MLLAALFCACQLLTQNLNGFSSSVYLFKGDFELWCFSLSSVQLNCAEICFDRCTDHMGGEWADSRNVSSVPLKGN